MLAFFQRIDVTLFYFVNIQLQNAFLDWLMPAVTNKNNWFPLILPAYVLLWWKGGRRGRTLALLIIPVILLSDQLSASLLKPLFGRVRPCVALPGVNMPIGMKTSFAFPSSHAANSFAAATLFARFYAPWRWLFFSLAALVGFSRVYVGVHYPFDVFAGAVLGMAVACFVFKLYQFTPFAAAEDRASLAKKPGSAGS